MLPIVTFVDGVIGAGSVSMLNELLDGYRLMISTHELIQGAAYDAEDHVDWALDWNSNDWDNPRFGSLYNHDAVATGEPDLGVAAGLLMSRGIGRGNRGIDGDTWKNIASSGAKGEKRAASRTSSVAVKRYKSGEEPDPDRRGRTREFRRMHDRRIKDAQGRLTGHYIEVKHGTQRATERVRRQIARDRILIRSDGNGVSSIRWEFHWDTRRGNGPSHELLNLLETSGIKYECIPYRGRK